MKIVGLMMVRNEDRFLGAAIRNIVDFCDRVIVVDTGSEDQTRNIAYKAAREYGGRVDFYDEMDLTKTHRFAEQFVGQDVWLFGVDGDEIYDPQRLAELRVRIDNGEFADRWRIVGAYLHVTYYGDHKATGYPGPPAHTPTKLYNMNLITAWPSDGLHTLFHPKTREIKHASIAYEAEGWAGADLRCLHFRFVRRSSLDNGLIAGRRLTPEDIAGFGSRKDRGEADAEGLNDRMSYRVGEVVTVSTAPFGVI